MMAARHDAHTLRGSIAKVMTKKIVLFVNVAIVAMATWGFIGEYVRNRGLQAEIDQLATKSQSLAQQNQQMDGDIAKASNMELAERDARMKLGLMKPGENVIVVRMAEAQQPSDSAAAAVAPDASPRQEFVQKWLAYFFH